MNYRKAYICSPLSAPTQEEILDNMQEAQEMMQKVSMELHCDAVAPHAYLPYLLDNRSPQERAMGLRFGMDLLELCDVLVICNNQVSAGMASEISRAEELNIPIFVRRAAGDYHPAGRLPLPQETVGTNGWRL